MSVEPTTSRASSPTAVPVWLPIIAPPICRSMAASPASPPSPPAPPPRAPRAWRISSGTSSPSCAGSMLSMPLIASTPLAAMGSQSLAQTGKVASSHSDRLQASILRIPEGNVVASSSHRSASRTASVISRRCASRTLGSPAATIACRATFLARSQLTGPPCQDSRSANWRSASANCCGSPIAPNGPWAPERPAGAGTRRPAGAPGATLAALVFRLVGQAEAERAVSHRWLCGRIEGS